MQKIRKRLLLAKEDYDIIMANLKNGFRKLTFNQKDADELQAELKKAKLVARKDLPEGVVRLNSLVTIRDEKEGRIMQLCVVAPGLADIRKKRISVLSPIGTALIGYQKGWTVKWRVPAGKRTFTILDVGWEP